MDFQTIKTAVAAQFAKMSKAKLLRVSLNKDALWEQYLQAFPAGTNPIFRERTEHDCTCCKQFVRAVGDIVVIIDGKVVSIWDVTVSEPGYQAVADAMASFVKGHEITDEFLHYEKSAGTDRNFEAVLGGTPRQWNHFHVNIPAQYVADKSTIPTTLGKARTTKEVFERALKEITIDAIDTVLDLIAQGSLYRGEEHKFAVVAFKTLKQSYAAYKDIAQIEALLWAPANAGSVTGIRNTVIGTLLTDLSEGKDLDASVKSFEAKVAPANYKCPTALVTPAMIAKTKETVQELGLTSALERRHAVLSDINVNNVLWANRSSKKAMTGDVFDDLAAQTSSRVKPGSLDKVEEVHIDKFIKDILPGLVSMEVLVENRHTPSFVSLIAPMDPTAGNLFKWDNGFSWSYNGEMADSDMRAAVKARGGSVSGVFRFTHQWNYDKRNASLMDLHVFMPGNTKSATSQINEHYGTGDRRVGWNNRSDSASGGIQDVDYTAEAPEGYVPIENITFPDLARMPEGRYLCMIHNWQARNPNLGGFKAEIEFGGQIFKYECERPLKHHEWMPVAEVTLKAGVFTIKHHMPHGEQAKVVWGLLTQSFHPVSSLMLSPNFWDQYPNGQQVRSEAKVGNKHFFFMLEGATNDGSARGFFNEFLAARLDPHRKVFEMVGSKLKAADTGSQLSGLGFSSTQRNTLTAKVKGSFTRTINITF